MVGVMDEVMSSGGVRAGCEAGCLFLEWQQWRVPSADRSCTTDTGETRRRRRPELSEVLCCLCTSNLASATKQNIIRGEVFYLFIAWTARYVGEISCDHRHPSLQDSPQDSPKTALSAPLLQ